MKRLFLLCFATACFAAQAMASDEVLTFECKRVSPFEMIRFLRSLSSVGVSFNEEGRKVIVRPGDLVPRKKKKEPKELVDAPPRAFCARFIKLRFADANHVAAVISGAFPEVAGNQEPPLRAAPNTRINQVFLVGTLHEIQAADALVQLLDRPRIQEWRGCGEAVF